MRILLPASFIFLLTLVSPAQATLFDFSYTNSNNTVIAGVLDGVLQADNNTVLVSSVRDFVTVNGVYGPSLSVVDSFTNFFLGMGGLPPILSLDGSLMDFIATTASNDEAFVFDSVGYLSGGVPQYMSTAAFDDIPYETYHVANWQMSVVSEPSALSLVMFLGLLGLFRSRLVRQPL